MADISKITASNGTTYDIKDATARDSISRFILASNVSTFRANQDNSTRFFGLSVDGNNGKFEVIFEQTGIIVYDYAQGRVVKTASWDAS